ncbi:MAG: zf-TFIIB domain-containing protein [Desulforhopalus sp.]|nr:zf-TFIIB domain-containing protein [Desulforhopalus sp.]
MKCPTCITTDLLMTDRQGVEIDYCPQCRGVWLDKGELDKIIERCSFAPPKAPEQQYRAPEPQYRQPEHHQSKHGHENPFKRKSSLKDFFDF